MPKKAAAKKTVTVRAKKKSARKSAVAKSPSRSKAAAQKRKAPAKASVKRISLGRPKVTADEKLYMLFKDDFHARQIFEFLRVETVRELEEYSPEEIVNRLSAPIVTTVQRIRRQLAALNRSLAGDQQFALEFKRK